MDKVYFGEVDWFDIKAGYGFINRVDENGEPLSDIFVHYSDINMPGFKLLKAGQKVSFTIGKNNAGKDKATEVTVIDK